jgi:hypothetical protein
MLWPAVILIALLIPLTAIVLDSPVFRAWVERRQGMGGQAASPELDELAKKVAYLETDLDTVTKQLAQLQEEHQFLQRLLEDPTKRLSASKGTSGTSSG